MQTPEAKALLAKLEGSAGVDGMRLARAFLHGYAGIGRGIRGAECISFLADETLQGKLRIRNLSWMYTDAQGSNILAGSLSDRVIPTIARMGVIFHAKRGFSGLDQYELADRVAFFGTRVTDEIKWRVKYAGLVVPEV